MVFLVDYIDHCTEQRIGCHFEVCSSLSRDNITWPDHMFYSRFDSFSVIQQNLEYENDSVPGNIYSNWFNCVSGAVFITGTGLSWGEDARNII